MGWPPCRMKILCCKVWLMPSARVPCNEAANKGARKTWTQSEFHTRQNFVRGQKPQKCIYRVYQPGDSQTSCKAWLTSTEQRRCSNEAKMQNLLKFAGVPKNFKPISAISGLTFTISWGLVEEMLLFNRFFAVVDICLTCKDIARQSCAMLHVWRFFAYRISSNQSPQPLLVQLRQTPACIWGTDCFQAQLVIVHPHYD